MSKTVPVQLTKLNLPQWGLSNAIPVVINSMPYAQKPKSQIKSALTPYYGTTAKFDKEKLYVVL